METASRQTIGWKEYVSLPEWGINRVRAKVDSGARTSALHVEGLEVLGNGQVRFEVVLSRKHRHRRIKVTAPVTKWARVRSSTGHYTRRCFVTTRIRIGSVEKDVEISLVSREDMQFRMLLGRTTLGRDFLIDVSRADLLERPAHKKRKPKKRVSWPNV